MRLKPTKEDIANKELKKLYRKAKIRHNEADKMLMKQMEELDNCPYIRKSTTFFEKIMGIKSQYDYLKEIVEKNTARCHEQIELNLEIKRQIIGEWLAIK